MKASRMWLPHVVLGLGIALSLLLWHALWQDIHDTIDLIDEFKTYLPWAMLTIGVCISVLLSRLIKAVQVARYRAKRLNMMNDSLKKQIKERQDAEESKQKLEIALMQGQKLQAMGNLAGGIAHDFNNLLYAIIGYTNLVMDDTPKETIAYKNLGRILAGANRGRELVARILAFSRREQHQFEAVKSKEIIEGVLALLKPTIPASVIINFVSKANDTIRANQTLMHQVLINIINNAVDAMNGEGTITIKTVRVEANSTKLNQFPNAKADQNYCMIQIKDTGHGMDVGTLERIFDPFYTTKEVGKGTGLGLSIVHSIIKEHHGDITVASQIGKGSTFSILLPEESQS